MERTELIAREGIRDLLGRYTWAGDTGRSAELAGCFTAEGVLDAGVPGGAWEGRATITAELDAVAARVAATGDTPSPVNHHVSSVLITMNDPTSATVRSYFCVYTDAGADHWGRYRDDVVMDATDGHWRFARRTVRVTGYAPGSRFADQG
ncbi:nuclear transport factor 2 family protein [Aquihabitans sp. McL0605]|uniref:nuclear transport factor 2 family protein n=1 Tax=Aquihabitans sp. McL0605 TaxID=3415671 RepID=UPI003CEC886F